MDAPNKEQVYDDQISPLMQQIIGICQQHGIAVLANFAIPTQKDEGLNCTSMVPDETGRNPPRHCIAYDVITNDAAAMAAGMVCMSIRKEAERPQHLNS